jgi:hypothetical protein
MDLDGNTNTNTSIPNSNATELPQRKRRRPPLACKRCRQQKIKCDREDPCNQCVQARKTPCTYTPDDRLPARRPQTVTSQAKAGGQRTEASTTPPSSTTGSATSNSASRSSDPFDTWNHVPASSSFLHSGRPADSTTSSRRSVATREHDNDLPIVSNLRAITDRLQMIEDRLSTAILQPTAAESRLSDQENLSVTGIFSKTRLFGQSNWRNSIDQARRSPVQRYCYNADMYSSMKSLQSIIVLNLTKAPRLYHYWTTAKHLRDQSRLVYRLASRLPLISDHSSLPNMLLISLSTSTFELSSTSIEFFMYLHSRRNTPDIGRIPNLPAHPLS